MRLLLLAALAATLMTGSAASEVRATSKIGVGLASCETWTADRRDGGAVAEGQWFLGFLSGVGYTGEGRDPLNKVDPQAVLAWMDRYCLAHPFVEIVDASDAFVREHRH
jgi:hypothetical protein